MSLTYDPSTAAGQVRLLAFDFDLTAADFSDEDVSAFLTLNSGSVKLAAAQALDVKGAKAATVQGVISFGGISTNGASIADAFSKLAAEYRRQVYAGEDGSDAATFDWAEMVFDPFSYRERVINQFMRTTT